MMLADSGTGQRDHSDRRIPDRRKAGLDSETLLVVDKEFAEISVGFLVDWMTRLVPDTSQRDHRVEHCRKNRSQTAASVPNPFEHPLLGDVQSRFAQRQDPIALEDLQTMVDENEKLFEPCRFGARYLRRIKIEFGNPTLRRWHSCWLVMVDDREGHHHRPCPRGDRIEVDRQPSGKKEKLDRYCRY